jgi:hypothetical protein
MGLSSLVLGGWAGCLLLARNGTNPSCACERSIHAHEAPKFAPLMAQ